MSTRSRWRSYEVVLLVFQAAAIACFFWFGEVADEALRSGTAVRGALAVYREWDGRAGVVFWGSVCLYVIGLSLALVRGSKRKIAVFALGGPCVFGIVLLLRAILHKI